MNLESIAKYFAPKSPMFSDSSRATATDNLTGTDVMTALGLVNAKCGFGFDLYLAKIGISSPDRAMEALYGASLVLCRRFKSVTELDEKVRQRVLEIMCAFAYQDYARSAASVRRCDCCDGIRAEPIVEGLVEISLNQPVEDKVPSMLTPIAAPLLLPVPPSDTGT